MAFIRSIQNTESLTK